MITFDQAVETIDKRAAWARGFINDPTAGERAAALGLRRMRSLLDALGSPDHRMSLVHVAGSKGKGSTAVFSQSILTATGFTTGLFTSPHLVDYRDRMVIDSERISETAFASTTSVVTTAIEHLEADQTELGTCTAFEMLFAMALTWFAESGCGVAVVEVGMGGMLDATNVITPAVSVITHLELEHTAILGPTITDIAINKAGIIKRGVPCVSARQDPVAMGVIRDRVHEMDSDLTVVGENLSVLSEGDAWTVVMTSMTFPDLKPRLHGAHQAENMAVAIAACALLVGATDRPTLDIGAVMRGVASAWIPGRMDVRRLANGTTLVIDGAHTVDSIGALATWIRDHPPAGDVVLIVGMLNDKDPRQVLKLILPLVDRVIAVPVQSPRGIAPTDLATSIRALKPLTSVRGSLQGVLVDVAQHRDDRADVVIVTGSLKLAAEVYRYIE